MQNNCKSSRVKISEFEKVIDSWLIYKHVEIPTRSFFTESHSLYFTMGVLVATLPLQIVCQLVVVGSPAGVTESQTLQAPTVIPSAPQTETTALPEGYIAYPDVGAAYKVYNESVLWKVARRRCISENGSLAVIDSVKKFQYISNQRKSTGVTHVGIHSLFDDDEWVSVKTGFLVTTVPWAAGEPNGNSRCAMVKHERGGLGNFNCATALGDFVCEISIPDAYKAEESTPVRIIAN